MKKSISRPSALNAPIATSQNVVVDLEKMSAISVQMNYSDVAPSAKTFDSAAAASLVVQEMTFTAVDVGVGGNDITIAILSGGTAGAEVVDVNGTDITITADVTPVTGSTNAQVRTAYNLVAAATALATCADTGTEALVIEAAAATPLAGGVDSEVDYGSGNSATIPSHGYITGTKVAATTTGSLPTGLSATNYWIVKVDANTVQFATSLANAVAGTVVNLTGEGSGVHTLTPAAAGSNVCKLQSSNDNTNWTDVSGKTVTISTSSGTTQWDIDRPSYRYLRVLYTPSAGQISLECWINQTIEK